MSQAPSFLHLLAAFLLALLSAFLVIGLLELRDRRREKRADPPALDDSTVEDLRTWNVVHEGHAMRNTRLNGMTFEALQDLAEQQGVRGFATMDKPELVQALGGDPAASDDTQPIPILDPDRTTPLPRIAPSPLVSPIPPGWGRPRPMPLRPVGPEPGTFTRELARVLDEETAVAR